MATIGVLLSTPDGRPATEITERSCRRSLSPAKVAIRAPRRWTAPVRLTPALRMNIARTVIVALFEKPATPSSTEIRVHGSSTISATMTISAVTSTGTRSVANSPNASRVIAKTTTIPVVTDGS